MTQLDALARPFTDNEILHFEGRGGRTMSYIEDESVMDRLDEAFGVGNWSVLVDPIPVYEGVVKVRLGALFGDTWVWYEDFGYPNREGGEALKEAVSDGIRRCGRYLGVARDLYRKDNHSGAARPAPRPAPVRPHVVDTSVPDIDEDWLPPADARPRVLNEGTDTVTCPIHNVPWAGQPGDLWHKDPEGKYCRHPNNVRKARAR